MTRPERSRALAWGLLCLSGLLWSACGEPAGAPVASAAEDPVELMDLKIGGDFELIDERGERFRLSDHAGQVHLLFFGYTTCPDFCPLTFSKLTRVYDLLGERAGEVTTLLVSVDPERDDPGRLSEYLGFFDVRSRGLTGSREEIDAVVQAYAAFYEEVDSGSAAGSLFNHSTYLYLIDRQGRVRYLFGHAETPERIAAGVRLALG